MNILIFDLIFWLRKLFINFSHHLKLLKIIWDSGDSLLWRIKNCFVTNFFILSFAWLKTFRTKLKCKNHFFIRFCILVSPSVDSLSTNLSWPDRPKCFRAELARQRCWWQSNRFVLRLQIRCSVCSLMKLVLGSLERQQAKNLKLIRISFA